MSSVISLTSKVVSRSRGSGNLTMSRTAITCALAPHGTISRRGSRAKSPWYRWAARHEAALAHVCLSEPARPQRGAGELHAPGQPRGPGPPEAAPRRAGPEDRAARDGLHVPRPV